MAEPEPECLEVNVTPPLPPPPDNVAPRGQRYTWLQQNQRPIIGIMVTVSVMGLYYLFVMGKYQAENEKIALLILGALPGILGYVLQYLFGGTASSDRRYPTNNNSYNPYPPVQTRMPLPGKKPLKSSVSIQEEWER